MGKQGRRMRKKNSIPIIASMFLFARAQQDMAARHMEHGGETGDISVEDFFLHLNRSMANHMRVLADDPIRAIEASEEAGLGALEFANEMDAYVEREEEKLDAIPPVLKLVH